MRVDGRRDSLQVDIDAEHAYRLEAVEAVLGRCGKARQLDLQLLDLAYCERHDQKDQAGQDDDDRDEYRRNGQKARHAGVMQACHGRLDQKRNRGAQDECTEKVAEQEQDNHRDDERRQTECDL